MSACNHNTLESCLRADECAECLREGAKAHSLHRDGSAVGTMTIEELEAYAWCLARNYPSQSARRARILANYIKRTNPPPNDRISDPAKRRVD